MLIDQAVTPATGGAGLPAERPIEASVGSLDMTDGRDRQRLMRSLRNQGDRRFGALDQSMRDDFTRALKVAMRWALEKQDHRAVNGCTMTMAALEKMNQADEHLVFKSMQPQQAPTVNVALVLNIPAPKTRGDG